MLPYYNFSQVKKTRTSKQKGEFVINVLLSTDVEIAHNKFMYQSIKHLEAFEF